MRGALYSALANQVFPRPPKPPRATTTVLPASSRSATSSPLATACTCVPTGTRSTASSPRRPCFPDPCPCCPRSTRCTLFRPISLSVRTDRSATSTTLPPLPPSPPSGPPRGTYFSRRKLTHPFPPAPPRTFIRTRSIKVHASLELIVRGD